MVERFQNPERAIAYLCDAMRQDGAGDKVLITAYLKGHQRARTHVTESMHMIPILERFCDRFCEAVAICGLHYGPYPVGGIQCHCYPKLWKVCPQQCRSHIERPLVTVVSFKEDLDITDEGRQTVLRIVEEEIERQADRPDDRIGRHGKAASIHRR